MFGTLGGPELFLIFVVALIVFGPRKLPEIGKSLGKMMAEFRKASENKFFLVVFSSDPNYDAAHTRSFLQGLAPRMIAEVPS